MNIKSERPGNNTIRKIRKRTAISFLTFILCLTLMPLNAFADIDESVTVPSDTEQTITEETVDNGDPGTEVQTEVLPAENNTAEDTAADISEEAAAAEETTETASEETTESATKETSDAEEQVSTVNTFTQNGMTLKFRTDDILADQPLGSKSASSHAWVTGNKKSMTLKWSKAADITSIDGYIVLRLTGTAKVYKEIARVDSSVKTYTDKKAKKKDTKYSYTVVGYKTTEDGIRISKCSNWAAGVTTKSTLSNGYKATISKTSVKVQKGEDFTLTLKYAKPKKTYMKNSFRWYSSDSSVVKSNGKGSFTANSAGTATITGRLASGRDITCSVKVVSAYKPGKPTLELFYSTTENIYITWNKTKHATSYDVYCAVDEADNYELIANVSSPGYDHTGLEKGHLYSYIVQARNDNLGSTALSDRSDALEQKAVKTPCKTKVTGFPKKKSPKAGKTYSFKITVTAPCGRTAKIQLYSNKKWSKKSTVKLPSGVDPAEVKIELPDTWWNTSVTKWRLVIPASDDATAYKSGTLKITPTRFYQNPKRYVQISNKISTHGYNYYTAPVLVNNTSTKKQHIEAMIRTAYKYLGDPYVVCQSRAPGKGVDCSGLVMQACYGAGVDLWPCNPYRHRSPAYEYESRNIAKMSTLKTVAYSNRQRGDLIFYANSSGVVIHVAIYLGGDKIIHSALNGVHVTGMSYPYGHVCKVKRIFN